PGLLGRAWARLGGHELGADPGLGAALLDAYRGGDAAAAVALGTLAADHAAAAAWFGRALDATPSHPVAGLNLSDALAALGRGREAAERARRPLTRLERRGALSADQAEAPPYPPGFHLPRVEWERAAAHAPGPAAEADAKLALLRWRLHAL